MGIVHRFGKTHLNADSLSGIPDAIEYCNCYRSGKPLECLPCGGCAYCQQYMKNWAQLEDEVDDVVPLLL